MSLLVYEFQRIQKAEVGISGCKEKYIHENYIFQDKENYSERKESRTYVLEINYMERESVWFLEKITNERKDRKLCDIYETVRIVV